MVKLQDYKCLILSPCSSRATANPLFSIGFIDRPSTIIMHILIKDKNEIDITSLLYFPFFFLVVGIWMVTQQTDRPEHQCIPYPMR